MYLQFLKGEFVVRYTSRKSCAVHLIKPFERNTKNVPCQLSLRSSCFYSKRQFVNGIFKGMKNSSTKRFLSELCSLNERDECTLHHEFLKTLTEKSEEFVTLVFENIQQHGKPFNIRKPKVLINITICLFLRNMTMISYLF